MENPKVQVLFACRAADAKELEGEDEWCLFLAYWPDQRIRTKNQGTLFLPYFFFVIQQKNFFRDGSSTFLALSLHVFRLPSCLPPRTKYLDAIFFDATFFLHAAVSRLCRDSVATPGLGSEARGFLLFFHILCFFGSFLIIFLPFAENRVLTRFFFHAIFFWVFHTTMSGR